jgi:hypothetical protein
MNNTQQQPVLRSALEDLYPHIMRRIEHLWGTRHLAEYLESLWFAERDHQRGLHPAAMAELMLLAQLNERRLPPRPRTLSSIYGPRPDWAPI